MKILQAKIVCLEEELKVSLLPALKEMDCKELQEQKEVDEALKEIKIFSLIDDRMLEPCLYFSPYFVLPIEGNENSYIKLLQSLRHLDQFAVAKVGNITQHPTALLYPYKDYLMLVLVRPDTELIEPPSPDWAGDAADFISSDWTSLMNKLEQLK